MLLLLLAFGSRFTAPANNADSFATFAISVIVLLTITAFIALLGCCKGVVEVLSLRCSCALLRLKLGQTKLPQQERINIGKLCIALRAR